MSPAAFNFKLLALVLLVAGVALVPSRLCSQDVVGGIRGSVQDADFFVPLSQVSIVVEGTALSATTDDNGNFSITGLAPGSYTLMAAKSGYIRARVPDVIVNPGQVREASISLTGEVVELDEFVVATEDLVDGSTAAQAISIRTEMASFVDVLGKQFFTQTGASDAAKALGKTTGINVADGKFVVVRGLSDRYNSVTLNGLRVPSSDPDRRAVALDLFPAAVIKDIRTSKTFLPDMPGEATGAGIDIITLSIPDKSFQKVKIGVGYNTNATGEDKWLSSGGPGTGFLGTSLDRRLPTFIRNNDLPQINFGDANDTMAEREFRQQINQTLNTVMGTKEETAPVDFTLEASMGHRFEFMGAPAGFTAALDYSKKYGYSDNDKIGRYEFSPVAPTLGLVSLVKRQNTLRTGTETMRAGALFSLGFELDRDSEITATYFFNRIAEDRASLQYGVSPEDPLDLATNDYRESLAYTERQLRVFQLEGNHHFYGERNAEVTWAAAYNQSHQLEPDHRFVNARYNPFLDEYFLPPVPPIIPNFQRLWRELYDQNYSIRLDVETDVFADRPDDEEVKFRFGTLLDYSDRAYRADSFAYNIGADNTASPTLDKPRADRSQTWGDVFLVGNKPVNDPTGFSATSYNFLFRANDVEFYNAEQIISAGYGMFSVDMGPELNLIFGARIESTDLKTQSSPIYIYPEEGQRFALLSDEQRLDPAMQVLVNSAFNGDLAAQQDPRILARSQANIQQVDMLPAFSFTWDYQDDQRIRGAVSHTIARPSFKEISPVIFTNVETGDLFVGNVDLQMSSIVNYDVRWEWFPEPDALIAMSMFAKTIDSPIELSQSGDILKFINVAEGHVFGFELEWQRSLAFVTEELRHWSIGTNYSYIQSSATRPVLGAASIYGPSRRLQGQPDYIVNFNLTYENPDFGLSSGLFLNLVGPQLFAVASNFQDPDVFQDPYSTLDFSIAKKLGANCRLTLRAANLLSSTVTRYYNNPEKPVHSTRETGVTYSLSLNFDW